MSAVALDDVEALEGCLSDKSPTKARKVTKEIFARARALASFPRRGRRIPELGEDTLRELIVGDDRVMYEIDDERGDRGDPGGPAREARPPDGTLPRRLTPGAQDRARLPAPTTERGAPRGTARIPGSRSPRRIRKRRRFRTRPQGRRVRRPSTALHETSTRRAQAPRTSASRGVHRGRPHAARSQHASRRAAR